MAVATYHDNLAETTDTTGTGTLTLNDVAVSGSSVFPASVDGDTVIFGIKDPNGTAWEVSEGVYTDSTKALTRTLISSSTGSLINISAAGAEVAIVVDASRMQKLENSRETLTAARTYYVRTDGSDSNTGLVDSAGGAFLTVQKAVDVTSALDMSIYQVTIQIKDGTYTDGVVLGSYLGALPPIIQGNNTTPSNALISTTTESCFHLGVASVWYIYDLKLVTTASYHCLQALNGGTIRFSNLDFGLAASHLFATVGGAIIVDGDYEITGNADIHVRAELTGRISCVSITVTLTGTPAFATAFARVKRVAAYQALSNTFSGSATGKRYDIAVNGAIDTNGAGSTHLPGDVAGTTATGGQYA